jgi:tetratricopeptide (TPR) repeat protein
LQDYLEEDLPDPRRYPDSENSVIRTWKLSFDQIAQQRPRAADLLSIMVLLDRQAIPRNLLKQGDERNIEFDKAIGTLQAYSLIKTEKGGTGFEVHRLVQLSTQRWLTLQNRQTEWQEKALELMVGKFPSGDYGTWDECESLLLHAKCVTKFRFIHTALLLQRAELLENIARYDRMQGRFEAAYLQYKDTLQTRESKLGKTHPETLTTMNNLALVLESQGKYTEAETINLQTLKLKEEVLGKTHPETLMTMGNLAGVLEKQGKYAEAETMNRQTLELIEEVLGKTHPETLTTISNLAGVLEKQGKYAEAETMNRQTLELTEEVLGKAHPETLISMSNLALVLQRQGKYAEAETMNRQTLELKEEVLGKAHPATLLSVYCLAHLLQSKKEYEEASILYERACTGFKSSLGSEHPRTVACTRNYSAMLDNIRNGN